MQEREGEEKGEQENEGRRGEGSRRDRKIGEGREDVVSKGEKR